MLKRYGDIISSSFFIAFSIVYFISTFQFEAVSGASSGAKLIPQICAVIAVISAGMVLYEALKTLKLQEPAADKKGNDVLNQEEKTKEGKPNYKKVAVTLCLIGVYAAIFKYVGFVISTMLYLILQMFTLAEKNERKPALILIISVTASLILYYLFTNAFSIVLPSGILF